MASWRPWTSVARRPRSSAQQVGESTAVHVVPVQSTVALLGLMMKPVPQSALGIVEHLAFVVSALQHVDASVAAQIETLV